jgi:tRNA nucleotidyltransferase (CCA-adding enzyme)
MNLVAANKRFIKFPGSENFQGKSNHGHSRRPFRRKTPMSTSKQIPNYVFEDLLFRRRLERTLNAELERFNALLKEQNSLIEKRRDSLCTVSLATAEKLSREEEADGTEPNSGMDAVLPSDLT